MSEKNISEILDGSPSNWGKWGTDDELGAVNYLDESEVLRGASAVEEGKTFPLGAPIGLPEGEPIAPGRRGSDLYVTSDKGHYEAGKQDDSLAGGMGFADDVISIFTHGTTHVDALGHAWYDDQLYNGFDANETKGGIGKADIRTIGEYGIVGRGVLLDLPRYRGVDYLERGAQIELEELESCAEEQGVDLGTRDIPIIRTGWIEIFYEEGPDEFYGGSFREPGITYTEEVAEWFYKNEIAAFGSDTLGNEQTISDETETLSPLHGALLRDQGIAFNEILKLDELAEDCAEDGKYDFLYVATPLKIHQGTGSPVNPIAIK